MPRNRDLHGLASRSNSVLLFPRDLVCNISTGVRRHAGGARCKSAGHKSHVKVGQGPRIQPLVRKPFHENTPHATNESLVFALRLWWQAVHSICTGAIFLDSYSLFHVRRSHVLESSCQPFDSSVLLTQCSLSQAQRYPNFGS